MTKFFIAAGAAILAVIFSASAQQADTTTHRMASGRRVQIEELDRSSAGIDTLQRIDMTSSDLVQLRDGKKGEMVLEVAGFGLTFGRTPAQKVATKPSKRWMTLFSHMEFGFTQLTGMDYAGYDAEQQGFLEQQLGGSFHYSFSIFQICTNLNRKRTLSLGVGLQYTLDNYRLTNNNITIGNGDGRVVPVMLDGAADKSKMVVSSLGIPIRLMYRPVKKVEITATAFSDFVLGADAIYKRPKEKRSLAGFKTYQFGVGTSVSYCGIGVYARYNISPLFKPNAGPACNAFSFGVSYSLSFFGFKSDKR